MKLTKTQLQLMIQLLVKNIYKESITEIPRLLIVLNSIRKGKNIYNLIKSMDFYGCLSKVDLLYMVIKAWFLTKLLPELRDKVLKIAVQLYKDTKILNSLLLKEPVSKKLKKTINLLIYFNKDKAMIWKILYRFYDKDQNK